MPQEDFLTLDELPRPSKTTTSGVVLYVIEECDEQNPFCVAETERDNHAFYAENGLVNCKGDSADTLLN
jgi:pyruvate formate-lyase activating enzyme-like uncharacterized protein